jgi:hypothetical protein
MSNPPDRDSIAKAMREAAWVSTHGTREERSGRFIEAKPPTLGGATPKKTRAAQG